MRRHTVIGERIMRARPSLARRGRLVRSSHERLDGAGYPDGLAASRSRSAPRIIAVCDAFDAMVSDRALPRGDVATAEALAELRRCAGTQFDPGVVEAFCTLVGQGAPAAAA